MEDLLFNPDFADNFVRGCYSNNYGFSVGKGLYVPMDKSKCYSNNANLIIHSEIDTVVDNFNGAKEFITNLTEEYFNKNLIEFLPIWFKTAVKASNNDSIKNFVIIRVNGVTVGAIQFKDRSDLVERYRLFAKSLKLEVWSKEINAHSFNPSFKPVNFDSDEEKRAFFDATNSSDKLFVIGNGMNMSVLTLRGTGFPYESERAGIPVNLIYNFKNEEDELQELNDANCTFIGYRNGIKAFLITINDSYKYVISCKSSEMLQSIIGRMKNKSIVATHKDVNNTVDAIINNINNDNKSEQTVSSSNTIDLSFKYARDLLDGKKLDTTQLASVKILISMLNKACYEDKPSIDNNKSLNSFVDKNGISSFFNKL